MISLYSFFSIEGHIARDADPVSYTHLILGVGYIEKKPAVIETPEGDTIAIRHKMYLSLSYDHRVVDGMLGGNFLHFIADYLENWEG